MSFWKDWSDGKKWIMGIVSAIVVAALASGITRLIQGSMSSRRGDPTTIKAETPNENKPFSFTSKQLSGDWNMEHIVQDQNWKILVRLYENQILTTDRKMYFTPFGPKGQWAINPDDGIITMYWQTLVRADSGRYLMGDLNTENYRNITCRLKPNKDGNILEGNCVDATGVTFLRLSR